jgi:pimeloyl-ACP methyl ester carboxylesterase
MGTSRRRQRLSVFRRGLGKPRRFVGAKLIKFFLLAVFSNFAHAEHVGIVLVHGKNGHQGSMQGLVDVLEGAGYQVDRPEMCWSRRRIYDLPYIECMRDIDAALERLRSRGANDLFVAGQSLGGNIALAFGARRDGLRGAIAMAAAHNPEWLIHLPRIAHSLSEAHALTAAGKADLPASFVDVNIGEEFLVRTTPNIYLSFFAPDGPAVIPPNAAQLRVPLLWIAGSSDPTQLGPAYAFAKADNPRNRYVTVAADHLGTPAASGETILSWISLIQRER